MLDELRSWSSSRYFGRERLQDLGKYTSGFEDIAHVTKTELQFRLLLGAAESRVATAFSHPSTSAAAEEALKRNFSAVLEQVP